MRILVVDDDPDFLMLFRGALMSLGYTDLTLADSGEDALAKAMNAPRPFDCFITDVQMPGMDGIELVRRLRTFPQFADTPIIMNTAMSDLDHIDRAFSAGATDYLNKPIDEIEIRTRLAVIHQLFLERQRAEAPSEKIVTETAPALPSYGFHDGIPMKRIQGAVDKLALQNYIKTLGMFRALATSVMAVQVINAREIYDLEGGCVFGEVMIDVATCLSDCQRDKRCLINYIGGGTFIVAGPNAELLEPEALEAQLYLYLAEFQSLYEELGNVMPAIMVAPAVHCRPSHVRNPDRLIAEATDQVRLMAYEMAQSA